MTIWTDAQLSPEIARFIVTNFGIQCFAVRDLGLRDARDERIFAEAREAGAIVMSKEEDFTILLECHGPPPKIIWITCGNTSNAYLQSILLTSLPSAIALLEDGEDLVEIF
jgi:predicted nuclease of predicted toxin-antitoxin system